MTDNMDEDESSMEMEMELTSSLSQMTMSQGKSLLSAIFFYLHLFYINCGVYNPHN